MFITSCDCDKYRNKLKKSMKEQRSISVPGINLEDEDDEENKDKTQPRPGSLFEVFMALKEKERYTIKIYKYNQLSSTKVLNEKRSFIQK